MAASEPAFGVEIARDSEEAGPGAVRISVRGELDSASALALLDAVHEVLSSGKPSEFTLDLSAVQFIDSTGLRALIETQHKAARQEVSLVVVPAPDRVTQQLQIAGVAEHLRLVEDGQTPPAERDFLEQADLELTADIQAPSRARTMVRQQLDDVVEQSVLASVVLMTSELVTNAVLHPSVGPPSAVGLRVVVFPDRVRVEVDDPGPGFDPSAQTMDRSQVPGPDQGGRGLFVVDRSAARWGVRELETDRGQRFSVWFEVDRA